MNTYTKAVHPGNKGLRTTLNALFHNTAVWAVVLALIFISAVAIFIANRPAVAMKDNPVYGNALELQYARPWLETRTQPIVAYSSALEFQYAKPWLDARNKQCHSSLEMLYACKNGFDKP